MEEEVDGLNDTATLNTFVRVAVERADESSFEHVGVYSGFCRRTNKHKANHPYSVFYILYSMFHILYMYICIHTIFDLFYIP